MMSGPGQSGGYGVQQGSPAQAPMWWGGASVPTPQGTQMGSWGQPAPAWGGLQLGTWTPQQAAQAGGISTQSMGSQSAAAPMQPAQQPQGGGWQGFQFQNPTSGFQQNFNTLAKQDPNAAFAYMASGYGGADAWNQFNNAFGPGAGAVYNQYAQFTPGSQQAQSLGLANPSVTAQTFDPTKYSGLVQTPEMQKQMDPEAFLKANPFSYSPTLFGVR